MLPQNSDISTALSQQRCVKARAMYDNIAEAPDELAFRKGDVLTVLEQNTAGLEGWWLCALRGRQGICPGNRLRILVGQYDTGSCLVDSIADLNITDNDQYKNGNRRSWHVQPNRVVTPQKCGDVYFYDSPSSLGSSVSISKHDSLPNCNNEQLLSGATGNGRNSMENSNNAGDCYDVPPRAASLISSPENSPSPITSCYDVPKAPTSCTTNYSVGSNAISLDCYDIPRLLLPLSPSSSASSLTNDGSLSGSNRSSLAVPDYDVPRPRIVTSSLSTRNNTPVAKTPTPPPSQAQQLYDVPINKELPLELNSALEGLHRLQTETSAAIVRVLSFVSPGWRTLQRLNTTLMDLRLAILRLRTSMHDLTEFAEGTLGNAGKALDKNLIIKLRPLVKTLRDSDKLVQEATMKLDSIDWDVNKLCRNGCGGTLSNGPESPISTAGQPDPLDQLIACARSLTEDVRQVASFIQGNSTLLFKRSSNNSLESNANSGTGIDYDYVNLDSRDVVLEQREELRAILPTELRENYDLLISEADNAMIQLPQTMLSPMDRNDKQLLVFYAAQVITHSAHLTHAIDAFLQTVEHNQPPKVFLAHGKFLVLSAHRLVHIGDTVHRNITRNDVRVRILQCANALSEALAQTVSKTKLAAQFFPSVNAVQDMVDSVVDISHLAKDLKVAMVYLAQQP
ncbi:breast cancer anti-estrogen resistance protein 1 [Prorops nasuta]|uniref:breast cancer anti-estrogen resistance protein 1 n=1 Tax=Prorops nasuta TaxID=863751 RepID=UPI0034CF3522